MPQLSHSLTVAHRQAFEWIAQHADRLGALRWRPILVPNSARRAAIRCDFREMRCSPMTGILTPPRWASLSNPDLAEAYGLDILTVSVICDASDGYDAGTGLRAALLEACGLPDADRRGVFRPLTRLR